MITVGDRVTLTRKGALFYGYQGVVRAHGTRTWRRAAPYFLVMLSNGEPACELPEDLKLDAVTALARIVE